jgi:lactate dehydrogenase-like 2-hydroxyacid dehydrogenase
MSTPKKSSFLSLRKDVFMPASLLALSNIPPLGLSSLEEDYHVIRLWKEKDPEKTIEKYRNEIVAIIAGPANQVSDKLIRALPNLEIISVFAVGTDKIDLQAAADQQVTVTNTPDILTNDTADLAITLMLCCARRAVEADAYVRARQWDGSQFPLGTALAGKSVGVFGLGRIGLATAKRAASFDMKILYSARAYKENDYEYIQDPSELASKSDFLILTCPGGPQTHHIIDAGVLEALGPKGYLINVARGSVVDESALLQALYNKSIAGAGLDVYENEPDIPEAFFSMDNVVLLPHIGSATKETRARMGQLVIDNIKAYFNGNPLLTPVAA